MFQDFSTIFTKFVSRTICKRKVLFQSETKTLENFSKFESIY